MVATPLHALQGEAKASTSPPSAATVDTPLRRSATSAGRGASTPRIPATTRAASKLRPATIIALPASQKGNGSQLVPLGSSRGATAKPWAMTTRA